MVFEKLYNGDEWAARRNYGYAICSRGGFGRCRGRDRWRTVRGSLGLGRMKRKLDKRGTCIVARRESATAKKTDGVRPNAIPARPVDNQRKGRSVDRPC